ncbi:hypothetical protein [Halomonas sp.]|uniref:hypothetical protein n=1 Tax=Halomonas sp. TaxID=1486246 RepID=UPI00384F3EF1
MIDVQGIDQKRKLAIVIAVIFVVLISWTGIIDTLSKDYVNASTVQALAAYAIARIINAAVSLASSITIGASLGFEFNVQPFQILDPINDLVEQYSSVMKFAISSLVIQKILVEAVSTFIFKLLLTLLAFSFVASMYIKDGFYSFFLFRIFAFFAMIRFMIVLVILMNGIVDQAFVDKNISPRMQEVSEVANQLENQGSDSDTGLSEDEREGLLAMRDQFQEEKALLKATLEESESEIKIIEEEIEIAQAAVSEFENAMGTVERLNIFSREEDYKSAVQFEKEVQERLDNKMEEISDISRQLDETENSLENTVALLEGRPVKEGWLSSASSKIAEFRDMAMWERIKSTVEDIIPSILNLMAAFTFKTLIMPLIFLALFLKGFKYIWGVDPRRWVKDEYSKMKEES